MVKKIIVIAVIVIVLVTPSVVALYQNHVLKKRVDIMDSFVSTAFPDQVNAFIKQVTQPNK